MNRYWENYKLEKPQNAAEIASLGLDFSNISEKDAKEKIFFIEGIANALKLPIKEVRKYFLDKSSSHITNEGDYLLLVENCAKMSYKEAERYGVDRLNTLAMIIVTWLIEEIEKIETKYSTKPRRTDKDARELLSKFSLEGKEDYLIFNKMRIYLHNFPIRSKNMEFLKSLEKMFDDYFEQIRPTVDSLKDDPNSTNNIQLLNSMIGSFIYMHSEALRDENKSKELDFDLERLIQECNKHYVSYYTELDLAMDRAKKKFEYKY